MHYLLFNESHDLGLTGQFCLLAGGDAALLLRGNFSHLFRRIARKTVVSFSPLVQHNRLIIDSILCYIKCSNTLCAAKG